MKQVFFIITIFPLFFFFSCVEKETVITGKVIGNADRLFYSNPNEGTCYAGFRDTIQIDESGNFELKFKLKQPSFILLWTSAPYKESKLLIEHGKKYHIIIDMENGIEILGDNEEGQRLYATLPNPSFISMQSKDLQKENSLIVIHDKIQEKKSEELEKFQKLYDENKISNSFFELIKKDRDCYYASLESRILQIKMYGFTPSEDGKYILDNGEDLLENLSNIYAQYPPGQNDFLISSFWPEYAQHFIEDYKPFSQKDFNIEKLRELHKNRQLNMFYVNESKKYLAGKSLEFFYATYMYRASIQNMFEKDLISLFTEYKKDYPQSKYTSYIEPYVEEIVSYYEKVDRDYGDNISFVEHFENINTLKEAIKPLDGKMIYVDVWATWCGPCKEEFKHSEALKKILKENDIQMFYISIDDKERDAQWREMIKGFALEGKHIRANEKFDQELRFLYDDKPGSISIPWYMLIDEKGNILKKHAKRPSEIVSGESIFE